jgi:hypothetical protein
MNANATIRWGSMVLFGLVTAAGYSRFEFTSNVKSTPFIFAPSRFQHRFTDAEVGKSGKVVKS